MKVAIVNDVKIASTILQRVICEQTAHEVVWTAANGQEAVDKCARQRPDLILMDLIMPVMNGVEATRKIMAKTPCAILIVTASVDTNASAVFEAMGAGALDAISTPTVASERSLSGAEDLIRKITTIEKLIQRSDNTRGRDIPDRAKSDDPGLPLIAIGASTGGPAALAQILSNLPPDLGANIVVIQHVDEEFVASLANWLNEQTALPVRLADKGDRPTPGQVLVARANDHLILRPDESLDYTPDPRDYVYRPSVNRFFESIAAHWTHPAVGVLLTGMGRDGAEGLLALRRRGMLTLAQDRATCAVYGMPKAAADLDAASAIVALDDIAAALRRICKAPECADTAEGTAQ